MVSKSVRPDVEFQIDDRFANPRAWIGWALSCKNLLEMVYGVYSPYCRKFSAALEDCEQSSTPYYLGILCSILESAKVQYDGGFIFDIDSRITGEILGNLNVMAKVALDDGRINVAGVLAAAALEDALKICNGK